MNGNNNRMAVFLRKYTDNRLYICVKSAANPDPNYWYSPTQIGGTTITPGIKFAGIKGYGGKMVVFTSANNHLYAIKQNGSTVDDYFTWSTWTQISGSEVVDGNADIVTCMDGSYARIFYMNTRVGNPDDPGFIPQSIYSVKQSSSGYNSSVKIINGQTVPEPYRRMGVVKDQNNLIRLAYHTYADLGQLSWVALTHQSGSGWSTPNIPNTAGSPLFGVYKKTDEMIYSNLNCIIGANYKTTSSGSVPTFLVIRPGCYLGGDQEIGSCVESALPNWRLPTQDNPIELNGFDVLQEPPTP